MTIEIDLMPTVEALVSKITRLLRKIHPGMRIFQKLQAVSFFCCVVVKLKKYRRNRMTILRHFGNGNKLFNCCPYYALA